MHLMDAIVQTAERARRDRLADQLIFPLYTELADKINPKTGPIPPRYVLDFKATVTATELTLGRPKVFRDVLRHLRLPYPIMWVEWEDAGRAVLRQKFKQEAWLDELRPYPQRMGFLIEAEPPTPEERREGKLGYRRGSIRWAWTSPMGGPIGIPNVSSILVDYDLDAEWHYSDEQFKKHPLTLATIWEDNPLQREALYSIWRTSHHYEHRLAKDLWETEMDRALLYADVVGEYIQVWASIFLLTESRDAIEYRDVDLSRLNKARAKAKKTPLLSHRTVHLHMRQPSPVEIKRGPLDFRRKSPHIHYVSTYMGHRGNDHWIVLPYMRGSGPPPFPKTTYVHG